MKTVVDYFVVSNTSSSKFNEEVKTKLKEGWELYGNLSTAFAEGRGVVLSQALIKHDKVD